MFKIIIIFMLMIFHMIYSQEQEFLNSYPNGIDLEDSDSFSISNFECPSVKCSKSIIQSSYYHTIIGTSLNNTKNLVVFRVCEILQYCIKKENLRIILHLKNNENKNSNSNFISISKFLDSLHIHYTLWEGTFSANGKMIETYNLLNKTVKNDSKLLIYHTDIDEIPDPIKFKIALNEIESGSCDSIRGYWVDRISNDGSLNNIELNSSLTTQYPLQCRISESVVGGGKTIKILAYRANLRVDGGQHDVWCDRPAHRGKQWNMNTSCTDHIYSRAKKKYYSFIMQYLPVIKKRPIYCKTVVPIDHYKFIGGVETYLADRMRSYSKQGFHWWKDSLRFIKIIDQNHGKICVNCSNNRCYNTTSGSFVEVKKD